MEGTCQVCNRLLKLRKGLLVQHGYIRPGTGYIERPCLGTKKPPYEESCETCREYLKSLQGSLANIQEYLNQLTSGEIKELYTLVKYTTSSPGWTSALSTEISDTKYRIRVLEAEVARVTKRIEDWSLKRVGC